MVESLAPVGLLEVNLAERAALLLWRLQRLARYEAETVAAAMEDAEVPAAAAAEDRIPPLFPSPSRTTRDEQLRDLRGDLRTAREELAEVGPGARLLRRAEAVRRRGRPFAVAESILEAACVARRDRGGPAVRPAARSTSKAFLRKLGLPGADRGRGDLDARS